MLKGTIIENSLKKRYSQEIKKAHGQAVRFCFTDRTFYFGTTKTNSAWS
jgi:hypothetical protein